MVRDNQGSHIPALQSIITEIESSQASEMFVVCQGRHAKRFTDGVSDVRPQAKVLDGCLTKDLSGACVKLLRPHRHFIDKSTMEDPGTYQSPDRVCPLLVPFVEDLLLSSRQFGSLLGRKFPTSERTLHANELGAGDAVGIALFFQPVSEDQARSVIVGMGEDVSQKSVSMRHVFLS
jgi:hypothetical protein